MKFAHEFQEALLREGFPAHWVDSAVPYSSLKKVIKKVKTELEDLLKEIGLEPAELVSAQAEHDEDVARRSRDGSVAFQYNFDGDEVFHPKLTLYFKGDQPVDASLSADTRKYLKALAASQRQGVTDGASRAINNPTLDSSMLDHSSDLVHDPIQREPSILGEDLTSDPHIRRVEIPLTFDAKFFELLQGDLTSLDELQAEEQRAMTTRIRELSKQMARLTAPSKFTKTDMYRWRALFDIYLQARIFFSTREQDHGSRTSAVAAQQLEWFQSEVNRQGLVKAFKLSASHQALDQFVAINISILQNLKFQEINQKAIGKILKKFDKRTHLGVKNTFPKLLQSDAIMSETMAKMVCAQVTDELVKITPQIDDGDYTCPICSTIAWRPIRLSCHHVLCSKCTVELQKTFKFNCPICRTKQVVKHANEDNIDEELIKQLKKYFPKETKEKRIQLETEDGIARFGASYKHPSEDKCIVM